MRTKIGIPLIPQSKISTLTQGMFVGAISDNFCERIDQKIFHAEIVVDSEKVSAETARYENIPTIIDFTDDNGEDIMAEQIGLNYDKIKTDVQSIVDVEIARIEADPDLKQLMKTK